MYSCSTTTRIISTQSEQRKSGEGLDLRAKAGMADYWLEEEEEEKTDREQQAKQKEGSAAFPKTKCGKMN